jgi:hypothetical protein
LRAATTHPFRATISAPGRKERAQASHAGISTIGTPSRNVKSELDCPENRPATRVTLVTVDPAMFKWKLDLFLKQQGGAGLGVHKVFGILAKSNGPSSKYAKRLPRRDICKHQEQCELEIDGGWPWQAPLVKTRGRLGQIAAPAAQPKYPDRSATYRTVEMHLHLSVGPRPVRGPVRGLPFLPPVRGCGSLISFSTNERCAGLSSAAAFSIVKHDVFGFAAYLEWAAFIGPNCLAAALSGRCAF